MAISFEQIQAANAAISTTNIKGKEYAEVNQRIKAFRMVYPMGYISSLVVDLSDGMVVMRAEVGYYDENGNPKPLGDGTAYEKESSSYINKTSYIENCETSAVGRALGMAGFGIDTSVASYEEVANAIENQKKMEKITQEEADVLEAMIAATPGKDPLETRISKICNYYSVKQLSDLDAEQYAKLVRQLSREAEA